MYASGTQNRLKRGRSGDLWSPLNVSAIDEDAQYGWHHRWDFVDSVNDLSAFTFSSLGGGTGTNAAQASNFGVIQLDGGATTQYHGRQLQLSTVGNFTPTEGGILAIEMLCKWSTISTAPHFAFGFATYDTTVLSSAALNVTDFIGLHIGGTDGHIDTRYLVSGGTAAGVDDFHTIVADADVKLGMRVTGTSRAQFWLNGLYKPDWDLTSIPTGIMTPSVAHQNGSGVRALLNIDWIEAAWAYAPNVVDE